MSEHTPGPWEAYLDSGIWGIRTKVRHTPICIDINNCDSNLVAAAPDMEIALLKCRAVLEENNLSHTPAYTALTVSISKARGKS